jgi:hypothetical protein
MCLYNKKKIKITTIVEIDGSIRLSNLREYLTKIISLFRQHLIFLCQDSTAFSKIGFVYLLDNQQGY